MVLVNVLRQYEQTSMTVSIPHIYCSVSEEWISVKIVNGDSLPVAMSVRDVSDSFGFYRCSKKLLQFSIILVLLHH